MTISRKPLKTLALSATTLVALSMLAACGGDSDAASGDGGSPSLSITSPDDGDTVGGDVEVTWDADVELGPPDSGLEHVHVFVDGLSDDYTVVGGNSFTVEGLSPGEHTIDVTLQHADHSSAGAEDHVDVTVNGSGGTDDGTDQSDDDSSGGFDY
jgi:hypothetical protein